MAIMTQGFFMRIIMMNILVRLVIWLLRNNQDLCCEIIDLNMLPIWLEMIALCIKKTVRDFWGTLKFKTPEVKILYESSQIKIDRIRRKQIWIWTSILCLKIEDHLLSIHSVYKFKHQLKVSNLNRYQQFLLPCVPGPNI